MNEGSWINSDLDNLSDIQKMLIELYSGFMERTRKRRVSDREMAKMLDIPAATLDGYVNGVRRPSLENALKIADGFEKWLNMDARTRWLTILGFDDYVVLRDTKIRQVVRNWSHLPREARDEIFKIANDPGSLTETWKPG